MSLIAATAIAVKDNLPYFLVEKTKDQTYRFFTTKMHRHNNDTSLGSVLRGLKSLGPVDFDDWRLGELTSVSGGDSLMSIYSFDVKDMPKIEKELNYQLVFVPANKTHPLLETLQTKAFVSFEE
ncbi:hypothetical protein RQW99_07765 [Leuconostoc falkenbergense]|uniref:hypothetical protein n=1 Tax=Leuconostoc falkenbergense TaxID=2766470 RepID=UPI002A7F5982|nr:hypothetical protein [Leuconostoc falkenbergense]MDY5164428.1 hypothetical protein [Leuconostoc falkenbergense]